MYKSKESKELSLSLVFYACSAVCNLCINSHANSGRLQTHAGPVFHHQLKIDVVMRTAAEA